MKSLACHCPTAKCSYGQEEIAVWLHYVIKYCTRTMRRLEIEPIFIPPETHDGRQ